MFCLSLAISELRFCSKKEKPLERAAPYFTHFDVEGGKRRRRRRRRKREERKEEREEESRAEMLLMNLRCCVCGDSCILTDGERDDRMGALNEAGRLCGMSWGRLNMVALFDGYRE